MHLYLFLCCCFVTASLFSTSAVARKDENEGNGKLSSGWSMKGLKDRAHAWADKVVKVARDKTTQAKRLRRKDNRRARPERRNKAMEKSRKQRPALKSSPRRERNDRHGGKNMNSWMRDRVRVTKPKPKPVRGDDDEETAVPVHNSDAMRDVLRRMAFHN